MKVCVCRCRIQLDQRTVAKCLCCAKCALCIENAERYCYAGLMEQDGNEDSHFLLLLLMLVLVLRVLLLLLLLLLLLCLKSPSETPCGSSALALNQHQQYQQPLASQKPDRQPQWENSAKFECTASWRSFRFGNIVYKLKLWRRTRFAETARRAF